MSNKQICASCLDFSIDKIVKSKEDKKPKWLLKTDHVRKFIKNTTDFRNREPSTYDINLKLNIGSKYAGRKILFWAADKLPDTNLKINGAFKAYNKFKNNGITSVSKTGNVIIKFCCPQVYRAQKTIQSKPHTYFRHLHFVISNKDVNIWNQQIYTKIVVCKYDFDKTMRLLNNNHCILLNTLPCEYYAKDHIPGSYNLPHTEIKNMSQTQLTNWIGDLIKLHYPAINRSIKNKTIRIRELPIVTYCANKTCNSSKMALEELMKKGFVNVNEYEGGMRDYRKNMYLD
jgi:rhodanese-related sulfurtransferase